MGLYGHKIFRRDRFNDNIGNPGGGLLVAVKESINAQLISIDNLDTEQIFVEVKGYEKNLFVGSFYPSPSEGNDVYAVHAATVEKLLDDFKGCEFFILGNYNLPKTVWSYHDDLSENLIAYCNSLDNLVQDNVNLIWNMFSFFEIYQYYPIHPSKGYTLDLAFSSLNECNVSLIKSCDSLVPLDPHHNQQFFEIKLKSSATIRITNKLNFQKGDYKQINSKISEIDWNMKLNTGTIEKSTEKFYSISNKIIKDHVPLIKESSSTYPCWYSHELISLIVTKKKLNKLWLDFDELDSYIEFKRIRACCIRQYRIDRLSYIGNIEASSTKNIKQFWNYVNNLSKDTGIPEEMFLNDKFSKNSKETCNLFVKSFELVYLQNKSTFYHQLHLSSELEFFISVDDVKKAIKSLENQNTTGPDGLSELFIKQCSDTIIFPLLLLFNKSLSKT